MKAQELRQKFTEFFIKNGHQKVLSSPLIPQNDPTLLFANAGMNQFKDYFTGTATPPYKRAVTIQKCVRAGGKHNDLENVGFTARHHTFFEMLGNFSFGDYFKVEAIRFAWDFLTKELKIPQEKLLITVHESDDEARDIWHQQIGVPLDKIFKLGDKDNFWEMGEFGPCGPCSEIFYDHGAEFSNGVYDPKAPLKDEGRFVEIWNLVFMQFEKTPRGTIKLPKPSVDTGAGLERLSAVVQGVYWNYDTDLFQTIIAQIEKISSKSYGAPQYCSFMRVVADHIRSATMLISDGALPSNEGRGHVLRRIIRRAVRHLNELGIEKASFYQLVPSVFSTLGMEYPENQSHQSLVEKVLLQEELSFRETLGNGLKILNEEIEQLTKSGKKELRGEIVFKLYDTFGFPVDLTEVILREKNLAFNSNEFNACMEKQKEQSRSASQFKHQGADLSIFHNAKAHYGATQFIGYDQTQLNEKLLAILHGPEYDYAIFATTPFYPESGGQIGDQGFIGTIPVLDTQRPVDNFIIHIIAKNAPLHVGEKYVLKVDEHKRMLTAKNHSATHLLQSALIKILGPHVKQAGSIVTSEKLRFDFTHPESLKPSELQKIENFVFQAINAQNTVSTQLMKKDEAIKHGAMALFGEKYGDEVRVISMGDVSVELCGGTHVQNTASIQLFKIISESSLSAGVRRIEAVTSITAWQLLNERSLTLQNIATKLSTPYETLSHKIDQLLEEQKQKNKEIELLQQKIALSAAQDTFQNPSKVGLFDFYFVAAPTESKDLRSLGDFFAEKFPHGILLLFSHDQDKTSFLLRTHKNNMKIQFNQWIKTLKIPELRGGGKADQLQGSLPKSAFEQFKLAFENYLKNV